MRKRFFGSVLAANLVLAGTLPAWSAEFSTTPTVPSTVAPPAATNTEKPLVLGIGAVAGYFLMFNPYGAAVMGAAMGAMIASSAYEYYGASASGTMLH